MSNIDKDVVEDFGREWSRFDQEGVSTDELEKIFSEYFSVFPWDSLPENAVGFDLGCGSGRWARFCSTKVGSLHCIDPSEAALAVAEKKLEHTGNCSFHLAGVDEIPLEDSSMDFGYSLGVLHHIPDTGRGLKCCIEKLKPNAPFLLYLYYALDNKPLWFRLLWKMSDLFRHVISSLPYPLKSLSCQLIALFIYLPLATLASVAERFGMKVDNFPLSIYRNKSFYTMRTDALDRFGTRLEKRFSRKEIEEMMIASGLENINFRTEAPYWCAVGFRRNVA